ncbi:MAG: UDP-N-acetylmuramoyl-tripeptide--D-alanyl-D-alanine ligase [Chitinophagaceae bacterium]|nr:UDP-N-acetylmuramoyl-tripeptide--D-alanyl-D-alanine ligase [Chitinophagaceae bacterium]
MKKEQLYSIYKKNPSVQTDTRKLKPGDLFFALKGANFNGNLFAKQALEMEASAVIVDEDPGFEHPLLVKVDDSLKALQGLAHHHRRQFSIPFLAITGSNGKTTTKELVHAVLSSHFKTSTTEGNLNNHIGIPLTILKIPFDAEIAVIEMGANHQREIASYCTYTEPTHGLINNVGKAHLEGFGGIEGVKKGKGELYDFIRETNGAIFINTDFDYLQEMSRGIHHKVTYGSANAETTGRILESDPLLQVEITSNPEIGIISTHLVGDYNLPNVLAAVSVGLYFKVPSQKIKSAIESYIPSNSRSQMMERGSNHIILDAYNANPSSMKLAIENFAKLKAPNKTVLLGAMAELGEESIAEHKMLAELLAQYKWHNVVLVGGDFLKIHHPFLSFADSTEAKDWFTARQFENEYILIKGSRSMKMEKILE